MSNEGASLTYFHFWKCLREAFTDRVRGFEPACWFPLLHSFKREVEAFSSRVRFEGSKTSIKILLLYPIEIDSLFVAKVDAQKAGASRV